MPIIASENVKSKYPPIPEGQYTAICYAVIDEGMQYSELYQKHQRKVRLMWELPDEKIEVDGKMKPRSTGKEYTLSLNEKGNLYKDLIAWRGKAFTKEELEGFDLRNILGKPCLMQIVHATNNGNTYANISGLMAMPKGMAAPYPVNSLIYLDWDADDFMATLASLPDWISDVVKRAQGYEERAFAVHDETIHDEDVPFFMKDEELAF